MLIGLCATLLFAAFLFKPVAKSADALSSGPIGQYNILTFFGASATNCGNFYIRSSAGVTQPGPSNYVYTATDGNGTVLRTRSGSGPTAGAIGGPFYWFGDPNADGTGHPFDIQPKKNPVHVTLIMDGVTIASVYGDDPCVKPTSVFTDGRLDSNYAGQTVALYCINSTLYVYAIDPVTSAGKLAFTATPAEIAKFPTTPAMNTAIKSAMGATLYRLTTGELQVNRNETTGKFYAFIFKGCP